MSGVSVSCTFAFGIFAVGSGLSPVESLLVSMTCVTSAGQLAAVPIIAGAGSLVELAISQLVINMRYALMSISLSRKFDKEVGIGDRLRADYLRLCRQCPYGGCGARRDGAGGSGIIQEHFWLYLLVTAGVTYLVRMVPLVLMLDLLL